MPILSDFPPGVESHMIPGGGERMAMENPRVAVNFADCIHKQWRDDGLDCLMGHAPRFYAPRSAHDFDWGWKRRCSDFSA